MLYYDLHVPCGSQRPFCPVSLFGNLVLPLYINDTCSPQHLDHEIWTWSISEMWAWSISDMWIWSIPEMRIGSISEMWIWFISAMWIWSVRSSGAMCAVCEVEDTGPILILIYHLPFRTSLYDTVVRCFRRQARGRVSSHRVLQNYGRRPARGLQRHFACMERKGKTGHPITVATYSNNFQY